MTQVSKQPMPAQAGIAAANRKFWLAAAMVIAVAVVVQTYGISKWPMADDEVLSLVTMGYAEVDQDLFAFPADHHAKLPRAVPVWHFVQRQALKLVPHTEAGIRIPSVIYGVLFSGLAFLLAAKWRGLWFAVALSIVVNGSQLFVHVAQVNRFYSMPLLLLGLAVAAMWYPRGGIGMIVATAVLAVLTIFSHNATVPFFGLAFVAAAATWLLGRTPRRVVVRSGAAFVLTALVYVLYLMPLISGWYTTGNPTPVLVSFAAYLGVPAVALGLLGAWVVLSERGFSGVSLWWLLIAAGTLCLLVASTFSWNPRYFVFYLPAFWMIAAEAMAFVASRVGRGTKGALWYACVIVLLLPNLFSHFADGSRHDYRSAAHVVVAQALPTEQVLSDDAETISYYLPEELRRRLSMRTKVKVVPSSSFLLVARSNAWTPMPRFANRRVDVLAEISSRRLDQYSHVLRVYRVH
jgi:hypothetical protein